MLRNLTAGSSNVPLQLSSAVRLDTSGCVDCQEHFDIKFAGLAIKDNHPVLEFIITILEGVRMTRVSRFQSRGSAGWSSEVLVECINASAAPATHLTSFAETEFNLEQAKYWPLRFSPHNTSRSNRKKNWMYIKRSGKKKSIWEKIGGLFSSGWSAVYSTCH